MANYLLIESRDPFEYGDVNYFCNTAKDLAAAGNDVTIFLIQNGVLMAKNGIANNPLSAMPSGSPGKISVRADDFSLKERGIGTGSVAPGVTMSNVDELVDLLVQDGIKAVWH
ncbi:MAG: sulfur reduction protein DsrE [Dehalococcoidia bacterium]